MPRKITFTYTAPNFASLAADMVNDPFSGHVHRVQIFVTPPNDPEDAWITAHGGDVHWSSQRTSVSVDGTSTNCQEIAFSGQALVQSIKSDDDFVIVVDWGENVYGLRRTVKLVLTDENGAQLVGIANGDPDSMFDPRSREEKDAS